ncbi:MAG: DUF5343 domain-containing protein, partial [Candidatus Eremiobacteraeota bacterium]|nr:DUF5343 domain-containing protein [Candidatus Eremiobacteraeota bacterium]
PGLFELNTQAQTLSVDDLKGKLSSITGLGERVVKEMAGTFNALAREADFTTPEEPTLKAEAALAAEADSAEQFVDSPALAPGRPAAPGGLAFSHTLYINLPATRDVAVYDAIFKALKEHLL